jgi:hypothetical protein
VQNKATQGITGDQMAKFIKAAQNEDLFSNGRLINEAMQ